MRDRLIELLEKAESAVYWDSTDQSFVNKIADFLMVNGVTFAEDNNVPCKKPMTNGDKIRSMTDEELIKAFGHYTICGYIQEKRSEWCETNGACSNCLLRWLKQPAEETNDRA